MAHRAAAASRSPRNWIAWWSLSPRWHALLQTWLYNTGKGVFGAALFHAMTNFSWQMFPNHGSHYDPRIIGLILMVVVAWVTITWGWRTLSHRATPLDIS